MPSQRKNNEHGFSDYILEFYVVLIICVLAWWMGSAFLHNEDNKRALDKIEKDYGVTVLEKSEFSHNDGVYPIKVNLDGKILACEVAVTSTMSGTFIECESPEGTFKLERASSRTHTTSGE
jgi:hypothetical protein